MIHLLHFYHQNKWQRLLHSDFWLYELSVWLHTFSRALIAVFIPIFILQIGYSIQEVIIYYLLFNIMDIPFNFIARWFIQKIGARWVTIIGSFFSLAFFASLYALGPNEWGLLLLIAFFAAVYDTFYWISHIYLFMKCSKNDKNISKDASFQLIIKRIAGIIAPAMGAAVIIFFDRQVLIIVSMIFLVVSVIPLFKLKKIEDRPKKKSQSFDKFFRKWSVSRDYLMAGFWSMHCAVENIIWPLFIFISLSSIQSVAMLPIIVSMTTIIFIYFVGRVSREKRNALIIIGSSFIAFIWLLRMMIDSSIFYYISVLLVGLFAVFISIPLYSSIYEKGEKLDALSASTYRNASHMFFKVIIFSILALMVNVFEVSFIIAAVSMIVIIMLIYVLGAIFTKQKRKFI